MATANHGLHFLNSLRTGCKKEGSGKRHQFKALTFDFGLAVDPNNGTFFACCQQIFIPKARAMWTWCYYLHSFVPAGKRVLRVNIDETSIKLDMDNKHSFISAAGKEQDKHHGLRRKMSKSRSRTAYSYVAVLCDDVALQKMMPQIIIVNCNQCPAAVYKDKKATSRTTW